MGNPWNNLGLGLPTLTGSNFSCTSNLNFPSFSLNPQLLVLCCSSCLTQLIDAAGIHPSLPSAGQFCQEIVPRCSCRPSTSDPLRVGCALLCHHRAAVIPCVGFPWQVHQAELCSSQDVLPKRRKLSEPKEQF
ncbi:hypothetical protein Nmel_018793 [Mimus melanotis]